MNWRQLTITAIACFVVGVICFDPPTYVVNRRDSDRVNVPSTIFNIIGVCVPAAFLVYVTRTKKRSLKDTSDS